MIFRFRLHGTADIQYKAVVDELTSQHGLPADINYLNENLEDGSEIDDDDISGVT